MVAMIHDAKAEFRRWEMPSFDAAPEPEAAAEEAPPQPTVRDLEALEQQARDEGRLAGLAEGRAAARQELCQRVAQFDAVCVAATRPLQALDEQVVQELTRLAMVVASRVIARELQLSPELIARAVREAANALPAATRELRVHLHPLDLALLQSMGSAESHWQLLADPGLERGDCRLESEHSRLDARVETRLAAMVDAVLGEAAEPAGGAA
ncbi:FliH/SctL family protein [Rhodanobacter sp. DHB23]|uniref:FliH/SctL family protein n=1 Tax=Rhodanobacter sp. DHB23 TaxID=2775923 RepID=UPI0017834BC5|nr:FliH/SctL family protein [Rhodanobacter sp. DHB23]MBD8871255.1 flagellar assembly protein FliH [Rhodanobacter sp. DHB23]